MLVRPGVSRGEGGFLREESVQGVGAGADKKQKQAAAQLGQVEAGFVDEVPPSVFCAKHWGVAPEDGQFDDQQCAEHVDDHRHGGQPGQQPD